DRRAAIVAVADEPARESRTHPIRMRAAPKEQPPRKLSGHRTGQARQRWKAARPGSRARLADGERSGRPDRSSQAPKQRGCQTPTRTGAASMTAPDPFPATGVDDGFARRHIGPSTPELAAMLDAIGADTLEGLLDQTIPSPIRT